MRRLFVLLLVAIFGPVAAAQAAGWSHPQGISVGGQENEAAPRVAIAADGTSVAAYDRGKHVEAVLADRPGHFGRTHRLGATVNGVPAVAAAPGGVAIVLWEAKDGIRETIRTGEGRPLRSRLLAPEHPSSINGLEVVADPRGGFFALERRFDETAHRYTVRALTLRRDGTLALPPQDFGFGSFGIDARPTRALSVDERGMATAVFTNEAGGGLSVAHAVHAGTFGPRTQLASSSNGRTARGGFLAATKVSNCGDTGCFGASQAWSVGPADVLTPLQVPAVDHPNRVFQPSIAPLADGRAALVYSEKSGEAAFSAVAPVKAAVVSASTPAGRVQTLTAREASEPIAASLSRGRVLVVWAGDRGFGAALAGADGTFATTAAPVGPPPSKYHFNATNRDVSTAGSYAVVGWEQGRRVRLSVRRF